MRTVLILLVGLGGLALTLRHLWRNIQEIRTRPKDASPASEKAVNYPLMALWFGYLMIFFTGMIVNNLILR